MQRRARDRDGWAGEGLKLVMRPMTSNVVRTKHRKLGSLDSKRQNRGRPIKARISSSVWVRRRTSFGTGLQRPLRGAEGTTLHWIYGQNASKAIPFTHCACMVL